VDIQTPQGGTGIDGESSTVLVTNYWPVLPILLQCTHRLLANLTETGRCDMIACVGRSKFLFRGSPVPQQW
jgi:hypothetical protein